MKDDPKISATDKALFRKSVNNIRKLNQDRVTPTKQHRKPVARQTLDDEIQTREDMLSDAYEPAEPETGEELLYARPGIQHSVIKKLKRGQINISAELDLHGMTIPIARQALSQFLQECQIKRSRCVRIIHGKGLSSPDGRAVLKTKVNTWLQQCNDVLAFCSARPVDGGTGAVYVLLKRN